MNPTIYNPYEVAQQQFDRIAGVLELSQAVCDLLRKPIREYHFSIPVRMDDSGAKIFSAFRIQHNDARGPCKGGIRFHPLGNIDTMRALAMWNTWRCAAADLPLGGSMGGVVCDLHNLSLGEQERLCRGWVRQIARNLGPDWDVPSPDLMASAQHMLWMLDEYETIYGRKSPGFITGKPVEMGGSFGRNEAAGYGLMIVVREALKELDIKPNETRASFQGFGNLAQNAAILYRRMGGTILSVSSFSQTDQKPCTFRKKQGINPQELIAITNPFGEIHKAKAIDFGYECLPGDAWIEEEVDILVPTELENQVTPEKAEKMSRSVTILAEGADGAVNPAAEQMLLQGGVKVIPDILANAGSVTSSYFEQVQSNQNYYWKRDEVLGKLDVHLTSIYIDNSNFARSRKMTLRDAVYLVAVDKVARACQERGWV